MIAFDVPGSALTQGSHRLRFTRRGRAVVAPDQGSARLREYRSRVRLAARAAVWNERAAWPAVGPVRLELVFLRPRPRGRHDPHPGTRPDVDKLARAILDALSGVLYRDDGQVVELLARKAWDPAARVVVRLERLA